VRRFCLHESTRQVDSTTITVFEICSLSTCNLKCFSGRFSSYVAACILIATIMVNSRAKLSIRTQEKACNERKELQVASPHRGWYCLHCTSYIKVLTQRKHPRSSQHPYSQAENAWRSWCCYCQGRRCLRLLSQLLSSSSSELTSCAAGVASADTSLFAPASSFEVPLAAAKSS
jgi:hypothetical protein